MNFIQLPIYIRLMLITLSSFIAYEQNNFKLWELFHKKKAFTFFYSQMDQKSISNLNWHLWNSTLGLYSDEEWNAAETRIIKYLQDTLSLVQESKEFQKLPPVIYNTWMDRFFELKKEAEEMLDKEINLEMGF